MKINLERAWPKVISPTVKLKLDSRKDWLNRLFQISRMILMDAVMANLLKMQLQIKIKEPIWLQIMIKKVDKLKDTFQMLI